LAVLRCRMLAVWSKIERRLEPLTTGAHLPEAGWLHAHAPTPAERACLGALGVPAAFLQHALDENELARVDHEGSARLVIVRVPRPAASSEQPWSTAPISVIVTGRYWVTIGAEDADTLRHIGLPSAEGDDPTRFVLRLLERVAATFLADLQAIDREVDDVESRLQDAQENAQIRALLRLQKSLVHFEIALKSNQMMLGRLRRDGCFPRAELDEALFDDVEVELAQAAEMTTISVNILSSMMDAFASIISNNLNVVMKRLTSLTLLVSIPTVVASFYGMNVVLPFAQHPLAFALTLVGSLVAVVGVGVAFRQRRWL
jgi:magnesium transporter